VLDFLDIHVGEVSSALTFGLLLGLGLLGGKLAKKVKLPSITGYLLFGILLNPYMTGKIDPEGHYFDPHTIEQMVEFINIIALSFIAYIIGGSLYLKEMKGLGKSIGIVTIIQGAVPFIFVFLLIAFGGSIIAGDVLKTNTEYIALGLVAGTIALATAPAATVAVLHEVKARGPLTQTILGVVALDDALAVIAFILGSGIALAMLKDGGSVPLLELMQTPIIHMALSVLLGVVFGFLLIYISRFFRGQRGTMTIVVLGAVVVCGGIAEMLHFEYILTCMAFGFVVVNKMKSTRLIDMALSMEDMVFVAFFAVVGAHFDFSRIGEATLIGCLILVARFAGKYLGSWLGTSVAKSPPHVKKWLGITLLPQAGVSIGLATSFAAKAGADGLADIGSLLLSSILVAVIITEIISPPLVRIAVIKSGEGRDV
jgi:Kef-type K+ transport system membrane component KefB